jgi:hypothetical protein
MKPARPLVAASFAWLFPLAVAALTVALRLAWGIGWGAIDRSDGAAEEPLGIGRAILDNLAYVAWAEQARDGIVPFTVLQTTEPHAAVLVMPVFVLIGWLARLADAHPLLLMNVAAVPLVAATLHLVYRSAREIGLSAPAANLAMLFTAFGSGLSPALRLMFPSAGWTAGADDTYLDLFPSTVFPFFPYHTLGLAGAATLLFAICRAEGAWRRQRGRLRWSLLTLVAALAAMSIRPYAPAAMLAAYAVLTLATWARPAPAPLRRGRLVLLAALAAGVGPLSLYYHWVSLQPVWSDYVRLDLGQDRLGWLIGFGLFWLAAAIGAALHARSRDKHIGLLVLWAGLGFALLLLLNSKESKFAEGSPLALAVLAALGVERAIAGLGRLARWPRVLGWQALALLLLLAVLGSLAHYGRGRPADHIPLDGEVVLAAKRVRAAHPGAVPTVLTEARAGALLPALASLRVYVGHWALTRDLERKRAELRAAGLEPEPPADPAAIPQAFAALLRTAPFDYELAQNGRQIAPLLRDDPRLRPVFEGRRWTLFRIAPP